MTGLILKNSSKPTDTRRAHKRPGDKQSARCVKYAARLAKGRKEAASGSLQKKEETLDKRDAEDLLTKLENRSLI